MATTCEIGSVTARPAAHIDGPPDRERVEQRAHSLLLGCEQRVVLVVVGPRPDGVAVTHRDVATVDERSLVIDGFNDAPYFRQPLLKEPMA